MLTEEECTFINQKRYGDLVEKQKRVNAEIDEKVLYNGKQLSRHEKILIKINKLVRDLQNCLILVEKA